MPYRLISQQMLLEHEVLARLSDALRTAIAWSHHPLTSSKLASVQFLSQSFQRHLERMLDLEEKGGYLELLPESHPELLPQVNQFRKEHEAFRHSMDAVLLELEQLDSPSQPELDAVLERLSVLLTDIDHHNKREMQLLQDAVLSRPGEESEDAPS